MSDSSRHDVEPDEHGTPTEADPVTVKSVKSYPSNKSPYLHLVLLTLVMASVLWLIGLGAVSTGSFFILAGLSLGLATITLLGMWAVFGPGTYARRLFWTHAAGLAVAMAFSFGIVFSVLADGIDENLGEGLFYVLLSVPPVSLAVQFPFWFFRACFGWQFVYGDAPPARSYSLRDLFTLTFIFALAIAGTQVIANRQAEEFAQYYSRIGPDEIDNSAEALAAIELERQTVGQEMRNSFLLSSLAAMIPLGIASLLAIPVVLFIFRPVDDSIGCIYSVLYAVGLAFVLVVLAAVLVGAPFLDGLGMMGLMIGGAVGTGAISLFFSRSAGWVLTSPKRYEKAQLTILEAETATGVVVTEPDHPLDIPLTAPDDQPSGA